ncbi:MAG: bifunctional pyr operon transcriptional regulator/uracil phosphoribosyltransferase PyrR [Verrucomicrobiota bacterium]
MTERQILDAGAIERTLKRIAHEILERNPSDISLGLIGIQTRGVPLAKRLHRFIQSIEPDRQIKEVGSLDISFHRDDMGSNLHVPKDTNVPFPVDGQRVILIDDVFYTGRTVRAAMNALLDLGRTESIQLAVLVDRGHRQLPIRADYVGKNIPTSGQEKVYCRLEEYDGHDEVSIKEVSR